MQVTNKNIRKAIRWGTIGAGGLALADVILSQTDTPLSNFFKGYSALAIPAIGVGTYAYIGLPIFDFDAKEEVLHIRSHMAFTKLMGKELHVHKRNIVSFEIDRKRLRKKLRVTYLKDGKEHHEDFSIAFLSTEKVEKLARQVELIHAEVRGGNSFHLFI